MILGWGALVLAAGIIIGLGVRRLVKGRRVVMPIEVVGGKTYLRMPSGQLRKLWDRAPTPEDMKSLARLSEIARRAR